MLRTSTCSTSSAPRKPTSTQSSRHSTTRVGNPDTRRRLGRARLDRASRHCRRPRRRRGNRSRKFQTQLEALIADLANAVDALVGKGRTMSGAGVLRWWRESRTSTIDGLLAHEPKDRLPWFAGPMSSMSFATARLMETWAHGQDIVDGLGVERAPTMRLRHVADIGVRTPVRVHGTGIAVPTRRARRRALDTRRLVRWLRGAGVSRPPTQCTGRRLTFCLVVTRQSNPADVALDVDGRSLASGSTSRAKFADLPPDHCKPS